MRIERADSRQHVDLKPVTYHLEPGEALEQLGAYVDPLLPLPRRSGAARRVV
jgi:hypothetical protein